MNKIKTRPFDMVNYLMTDDDDVEYLRQVLEDGDTALLAAALSDIARAARHGVAGKRYGPVTRESVQKPVGRACSEHRHTVQSHTRVGF